MVELYHYTTGAGLLGMLKDYDAEKNPNLTIWATHYAYMNDPTEFEFGKKYVCLSSKRLRRKTAFLRTRKYIPF